MDKLEKYRFGRWQSKGFPQIKGFRFVGCPPKKRSIGIDDLNDLIYDVAMSMDSPKGSSPSFVLMYRRHPVHNLCLLCVFVSVCFLEDEGSDLSALCTCIHRVYACGCVRGYLGLCHLLPDGKTHNFV